MNRGAQLLAEKLAERGAQQRLSEALGTTPGVVSHWVTGQRLPSARFRGLLNASHGIDWMAWDEPEADAPAIETWEGEGGAPGAVPTEVKL